MIVLIKALQVILALSVIIIVHEFGHFIWARIFGIKVEKFYLFFDVGGKAIAKWKWGETEFGIGLLPFGGYCKIAGMVDESMDSKQLKEAPKDWEFRSKAPWKRLLVLAGGVINNFIFALIVYISIMAIWGQAYIDNKESNIYVNDLAYEMGFRNGDRILSFDDYVPEKFSMLQADLARRQVHKAKVLRGVDTVDIYIDQSMIEDVLSSSLMFDLAMPFVIDSVVQGPNFNSGLRQGDKIVALEGQEVEYFQDCQKLLSEFKNRDIVASVLREGDTLDVKLQVDSLGRIGVYVAQSQSVKIENYDILRAIPAGIKYTSETLAGYLRDLRLVAQPSTGAYKSVGSFISIGRAFPSSWNWYGFLNIIALISIMLGVLNLIPIPGLDGGHIIFTLYEMVSGRKPSDKFLMAAQMVGMIIIIAIMILALGNDILRIM